MNNYFHLFNFLLFLFSWKAVSWPPRILSSDRGPWTIGWWHAKNVVCPCFALVVGLLFVLGEFSCCCCWLFLLFWLFPEESGVFSQHYTKTSILSNWMLFLQKTCLWSWDLKEVTLNSMRKRLKEKDDLFTSPRLSKYLK